MRSLWGLAAVSVLVFSIGVVLAATSLTQRSSESAVKQAWQRHRDESRATPEEAYRQDRFRAIQGRITNTLGEPIIGAIVRCSRVDRMLDLARLGALTNSKWYVPIEATAVAGADGTYSFPHLPVGAYSFFYSAPGAAPASKDLIVVQDGLGADLAVKLERPGVLRVGFDAPAKAPRVLTLVPHRWWPELPTAVIAKGEKSASFSGLGGPLRRGLIVASQDETDTTWRVVGRFDLDVSNESKLSRSAPPASIFDLPEAAGLGSWSGFSQPAERVFYAAISPIALLWPRAPGRLGFPESHGRLSGVRIAETPAREARGFGPQAFLPVLADSPEGGTWFGWASDASEFEFMGLPAGPYRVRALDVFGKPTFARGIHIRPGSTAKLSEGPWTKPEIDEPDAREIMGTVRWESGAPVARAVVFVQHAGNFRLFLRRIESDENGFFRVGGVPGDALYFAFAIPSGDDEAMREFGYFSIGTLKREAWRDLTVHPHRVVGQLNNITAEIPLQLIEQAPTGDRVVWSFRTDPSGRFTIANVPHGRYCVQTSAGEGVGFARSLTLEIGDGRPDENVRWP